jgi:hypothetical protein
MKLFGGAHTDASNRRLISRINDSESAPFQLHFAFSEIP